MRQVKVLGSVYTIEENNCEHDGICLPNTHEIRLSKTTRDRESLLHEIFHAIMFEGGLYCTITPEIQEVIAQQFAQVLNSNFSIRFKK